MQFEIQLQYTERDYLAYWFGFIEKQPGQKPPDKGPLWMYTFFSWFWVVMGVLCAAVSLWLGDGLYLEDAGWLFNQLITTPLGGLAAIGLGLLLFRSRRTYLRRSGPTDGWPPPYPSWVKRAWKKYQAEPDRYLCRFTEETCQIAGSRSDYSCAYDLVDQLWEDEGRFYLIFTNKNTYMLPKRAFTQGDPAALPAFWQEKTGRPVRPVNAQPIDHCHL